jgi:hypothetical protein
VNVDLTNISCGGPGDCTATGTYLGTEGVSTAYYVSETAGTWGTPKAITSADQPAGTYSEVNGLSCAAVGYCAIVGRYTDQGVSNAGATVSVPFTLDEAQGSWGTPQPVPGLASLPGGGTGANLTSVSCAAAGECSASGPGGEVFVVSETGGTWGGLEQLAGTSGDDALVSCPAPRDCTVAGTYGSWVFTADEANGAWGQGQKLNMPSVDWGFVNTPSIACRFAGNCVIVGIAADINAPSTDITLAATESSSGSWGAAAPLPGNPVGQGGFLQGLSCVPGGDCTIAVSAADASGTPYVYTAVSRTDGAVGSVQHVYQSKFSNIVFGLSCPQDGHCVLAVESDNQYLLGTEATTSTVALTASAPKVTYGAEQSETLTATTSSTAGGTPTGAVTVTGPAGGTPCTITLANGTGSCKLTARQLPAGTDTVTAAYGGDISYAPASGTATVTVSQAATATHLSFTPGSTTFSAAAAKLTVTGTVSSAAGTPNGWTTVRVDGHAVSGCTNIWFAAGMVSCTGTTAVLTGGKHTVTLSYSGRGDFAASASPAATLTVGVARSTPALSLSRSSVTYGSENAEKFTVSASHAGSVYPTGKAQVRIGGSALCTVTLSKGAGSCTLTAKQLRAGSYTIIAVYLGDVNYHSSQSAGKSLKVAA